MFRTNTVHVHYTVYSTGRSWLIPRYTGMTSEDVDTENLLVYLGREPIFYSEKTTQNRTD